ncbi:MAG: peptidoglycan DD-metalloendopeptidase family protein [Chloroflexi bacterium]|nr:peptidoglycan DD-metalloendopeptidase family protein [Chloroflexota bacterium]
MSSPKSSRIHFFFVAFTGAIFIGMLVPLLVLADPCAGSGDAELSWCRALGQERQYQRGNIITYVVKSGDSLWTIAARFDLDIDTLRYSNPELRRNPDVLRIDQQVRILPFIGAIYTIVQGDTLESIAKKWNVEVNVIVGYGPNGFDDGSAKVGEELIIPGGYLELNIAPPAKSAASTLAWPLRGWLSQGYGSGHRALDIATPYGSPVYAAVGGTVSRAGWLFTGYGYSVILNHGNGLQTLYSHLKGPLVQVGQRVGRGQAIGAVGSTGRSTGPHVHFELRKNGERINPLPYLPALPPH